jgi:hypothetical protein
VPEKNGRAPLLYIAKCSLRQLQFGNQALVSRDQVVHLFF